MEARTVVVILVTNESVVLGCLLKLFGDTVLFRLLRQFRKSGVKSFVIASTVDSGGVQRELSRFTSKNPDSEILSEADVQQRPWGRMIFVPANLVSDSETIRRLISFPENFVLTEERAELLDIFHTARGPFLFASLDGRTASESANFDTSLESDYIQRAITSSGFRRLSLEELSCYLPDMKAYFRPFCQLVSTERSIRQMEHSLVRRIQKGKHFTSLINKPIEDFISTRAARLGISPNEVTLISNILAYLAVALMLSNQAKLSIVVMMVTCIVDGLDGKIARLRSMESNVGTLEHSFDFLYEQVWYGSFVWYVFAFSQERLWLAIGIYMLIVDAFVRHIYNQFRITAKIALTESSSIAKLLARVDGRRNIYVIYILTGLLASMPTLSLTLMALHASMTAVSYSALAWLYLSRTRQSV